MIPVLTKVSLAKKSRHKIFNVQDDNEKEVIMFLIFEQLEPGF